jgi:alpha-glucosidase (family GH31 glycosyl hydrolase)
VHWPGDQRTDFEHDDGLFTVVPMALNLGLAGWSTTGADIGGYQDLDNAGPSPYGTKELFLRWAALGALEPVMRTHHGRAAYANWHFDSDEETLEQYRRWAIFHLRLYPYLDGGAFEHEQHGLPLIRAFPLMNPEDPAGWSIDDEYFLGDDLLVAPVLDSGLSSRPVHLPPGSWIPIAPLPPAEPQPPGGPQVSGAAIAGPVDINAPAPLGELPLWVRAGAVIPLLQDGIETLLPAPGLADLTVAQGARTLLVFTGAAGQTTERDGTNYALAMTADSTPYTDNGAALQPCASASARGCIEAGTAADGATRVRLAANGPLQWPGYTLSIHGPSRIIDVEIH